MYWLRLLFGLSVCGYLAAVVVLGIWFFKRGPRSWIAGCSFMAAGLVSQIGFIVAMGIAGGRPPLANTFETLVFMAACVGCLFIGHTRLNRARPMAQLAPFVALAVLVVTLLSYLLMPADIDTLVPALRNKLWLTVHVAIIIVSYAAFALTYLGAIAFLAKEEKSARAADFLLSLTVSGLLAVPVIVRLSGTELWARSRWSILGPAFLGVALCALGLWPLVGWADRRLDFRTRLPDKAELDKLVYGTVAFGFPFLTVGIITGSYWASVAWGRYWGWDDKEVASLVTWLIYAAYLHFRLAPRWKGPCVAWIAAGGFWCVLFTYFGVNYLLSGLHSYG